MLAYQTYLEEEEEDDKESVHGKMPVEIVSNQKRERDAEREINRQMLEIHTKSVKCGDCSILRGDADGLLIDCGSDNRGNGLSSSAFAYSKIENHIKSCEIKRILISHFHKDHFNGILEIPDYYRVNKTYLPYSIIDEKVMYIDGLMRLLAVAPPRSWGFRLSKIIIELFRKLSRISQQIEFLKKGDSIPFEKIKIRILWPEVNDSSFKYNDLPVKIVADTTKSAGDAYIQSELLGREMNLSAIEEKLENDFEEIVGNENQELRTAMGRFYEHINTYIRRLHDNVEASVEGSFDVVHENYNALLQQHDLFIKKLHPEKFDKVKFFARQQYHSLVTSMNAISIVCDYNEKFIFLGDAPANVVDFLYDNSQFSDWYHFVKVQHHGTPSHFTLNTPKGEYNVISNGGHFYRKVSEEYLDSGIVLCTNAHELPEKYCQHHYFHNECSHNCIKNSNGFIRQV